MAILENISDWLAEVQIDELLEFVSLQCQTLIKCFIDGFKDKSWQFAATSPALIPQLHLELEQVECAHELALIDSIDGAPCDMEKGRQVLHIPDLKIERRVSPQQRDTLPRMKLLLQSCLQYVMAILHLQLLRKLLLLLFVLRIAAVFRATFHTVNALFLLDYVLPIELAPLSRVPSNTLTVLLLIVLQVLDQATLVPPEGHCLAAI